MSARLASSATAGSSSTAIPSCCAFQPTAPYIAPVPTRSGSVPAEFYRPARRSSRTVLLVPGIHSMGIREPRLTALAQDLAGSGITVMTLALPDLQHYRITVNSTDVIEDAVGWMTQ